VAKATAIKTKADEVEVFDEIEQGSLDWFEIRRGCCTASNFATILASGRDGGESVTRRKLMRRLAGEIMTGEVAETYRNAAMDRGNAMEPEARDWYSRTRFADLSRIGFVRRTVHNPLGASFVVGCSPDSFIGKDGVLEIKTMIPELMIDVAEKGAAGFPPEHRAQVQGSLWVTGRAWCDLVIFYRNMPITPVFRVERDGVYIQELARQVEIFDYELRALVAKIRKMGAA